MGVVYQARHNQTGQMVALKLIMPETATTRSAIDRFQREMSVISQLRHPNIVEWYEQGMTRGQFWFAMEYVAGTNLEALAKAESRPLSHDPGLPPDLPDPQGAGAGPPAGLRPPRHQAREHPDRPHAPRACIAKISDFGLAKSFRGVGLSGLTFSGEMRGTVPFMPPEQMLDFKTVTPLGRPLRHGRHALLPADLQVHLRRAGRRRRPDPHAPGGATRVPIRSAGADVPAGLAAVIEKCLARDPKDRFPNAASMRQALKPFC